MLLFFVKMGISVGWSAPDEHSKHALMSYPRSRISECGSATVLSQPVGNYRARWRWITVVTRRQFASTLVSDVEKSWRASPV